jgi:hypothetical protein
VRLFEAFADLLKMHGKVRQPRVLPEHGLVESRSLTETQEQGLELTRQDRRKENVR